MRRKQQAVKSVDDASIKPSVGGDLIEGLLGTRQPHVQTRGVDSEWAVAPPLDIEVFSRTIGYTVPGVYRLLQQGRLPDGTSFRVGSLRKFCPYRAAAIARGELKILSVAEAKERRDAQMEHEVAA